MIIFNDAQTLSYSNIFNYIGDATNFNNSATLSIKGKIISDKVNNSNPSDLFGLTYVNESGAWIPMGGGSSITTGATQVFNGNIIINDGFVTLGLQNEESIETDLFEEYSPLYDIWEEMDDIRNRFSDFQEIYLNGVSVGSGRVTNISFPTSRDPRSSEYIVNLEVFRTGNWGNLSGEGYNFNISEFSKYINSFNEYFTTNENKDGTVGYSRNLSFSALNPESTNEEYLSNVKTFASGFFAYDPLFSTVQRGYPDFYEDFGSKRITESYDTINGSFTFSENFIGPQSGKTYKHEYSISVNLSTEKSSITQTGKIIGVKTPILTNATIGYQEISSGLLSNLQSIFNSYSSCGTSLYLSSSKQVINEYTGEIEYSFEFSNSLLSSGCFEVSRNIQINISENGQATITESGTIKSICEGDKLAQARAYFSSYISTGIGTRVFEIYSSDGPECGCNGGKEQSDLLLVSKEETFSEFNGEFGYSYVYKTKCEKINSCFFATRQSSEIDSTHNVFFAMTPGALGEIAQKQNTSSLASLQQNITIKSSCDGKTLDEYLSAAASQIITPSSLFFADSIDYTFDPENSQLVLSVVYKYVKYRSFSNSDV